jgi:hypothetical protein
VIVAPALTAWCRFFSLVMDKTLMTNPPDWPTLLRRVKSEVAALGAVERVWLNERLAIISETQVALDELFRKAHGIESCSGCDGACCDCGRHHITLTNLLAYLLAEENPPPPDFNRPCPYLGDMGCRLSVERRPYNCITFFCEELEEKLAPFDRERLRTLDCQLRSEYQRVADRYPAASLRGLWIALGRVGDGRLLRSTEKRRGRITV